MATAPTTDTPVPESGLADPLAWRPLKAPSLIEFEVIATEVYRRLPARFRGDRKSVV